ncbi:hypothetical protein GC176_19185 [bacterium]|nr:hypothetical protein [bacterium]
MSKVRLLLLMVSGICFWRSMPEDVCDDVRSAAVSNAEATIPLVPSRPAEPKLLTRPIEEIRVGQRVLAHNPEVSEAEREGWVEPDWKDWQLVSLEMPKPDGSLLKIEMLRPTEWLDTQAALLVETREIIAHPGPGGADPNRPDDEGSHNGEASGDAAVTVSDLSASSAKALDRPVGTGPTEALPAFAAMPLVPEVLPVGLVVEMDLPELGLTDLAWVTDIADVPEIETGDGQVVTATFHHSSGDVIDLTVEGIRSGRAGSEPETIGTTGNHPFWSVDRQEYVQAGQLDVGERVLTFSGDTKRVVTKLPRPGPQPVYNLEVHAEHVYFVGQDGVLVHNSQSYISKAIKNQNAQRADGLIDHIDPRTNLMAATRRSELHGDHLLAKNRIKEMIARREVAIDRKLTGAELRQVSELMNGSENLRPMLGSFNSSKQEFLSARWRRANTDIVKSVDPEYLRDLARTQRSVHRQMQSLLGAFR